MEDAIALSERCIAPRRSTRALQQFETGRTRRGRADPARGRRFAGLVRACRPLLGHDPTQFAFGLMTRSKSITYDNLRCARRTSSARPTAFARQVRANGFDVDVERPLPPMFQPLRLRDMMLANRVVVSPMCMYSANDGMPDDWHLVHYGSRAIGGAGLMFTEMTCVRRTRASRRAAPGCGTTSRKPRGGASSISCTPIRRRSSACSSAMPAARARRN